MDARETEEISFLIVVKLLEKIMATLDQVLAEVTDEGTRLDSIDALIVGLQKQVADALANTVISTADQAKLDAVFAGLQSNKAKIDTALNTGVPVAPAAP